VSAVGGNGEQLVSASEIAELAGVTPSAVSNWRKRFSDFPLATGTAPGGGDLFALADVERWVRVHGREWRGGDIGDGAVLPVKGDSRQATEQIWAVAERLRGKALGGDLVGVVAATATLIHLTREEGEVIPNRSLSLEELGEWAQEVAPRLEVARPEFRRMFVPLAALESRSLGLLVDSLAACRTGEELAVAVDLVLDRGLRYGEFRTPDSVAELLADLAEPRGVVLDPAVGSGQFLIRAAETAAEPLRLLGQEVDENTWRIASARLLLRNLQSSIELGDSLAEDRFFGLRADVVACEPPAGARRHELVSAAPDTRWELLGSFEVPPPRASEFAWLAHIISHLAADGRGYVLLPTGSLFRGGVEARFRSELLRRGTIEAILALPAGTSSTTAASALWIVRPPTSDPAPVLFVDGTGEPALTPPLRQRIIQTVDGWRSHRERFEAVPGFARSAPVLELLAGEAALIPSRLVYESEAVDTEALLGSIEEAERELAEAHTWLPPQPPRPRLIASPHPPRRLRVRDLIDLGFATLLRPARIKTESYNVEGNGLPVWLPGDINDPWRRNEPPHFIDADLVDARSSTQPGDIVFTTIGSIRTRVDQTGGHVLGTSLQALRLNANQFNPHAVAALLTSEPNSRLLTGTTIPRINVLELEIPQLDLAAASATAEVLRNLERELEAAHAVVARAELLRKAVVDAIATGAATIGPLPARDDD